MYTLYFDGCSKGNPGRAGAGAVLYRDNEEVWSGGAPLPHATNNQAEYTGLLVGLQYAVEELGLQQLLVRGDSKLVIEQMAGRYACRAPTLAPLLQEAHALAARIPAIQYEHVLRHLNQRADALSNEYLAPRKKN